jgi:hypothetical protein
MDKRWMAGLLVGCSMAAFAGTAHRTTMKDAEASMLLTGTINVDPGGAVTGFTIDPQDKVPSGVVQLVDSTVPQWRFEPVARDGKAVAATTTMSMLVVASQPDDTHYRISLKGATFGDGSNDAAHSANDEQSVTAKSMRPPEYPSSPYLSGVAGSVYLAIRIDHLGRVYDASVEQVNLRALGSARDSDDWRRAFSEASLRAAKRWTFNIPAAATPDEGPFFAVRVPIDYQLQGEAAQYGTWSTYIPGPRQTIPWLELRERGHWSSPDALVAGGVYQLRKGLHLLTPPGQG